MCERWGKTKLSRSVKPQLSFHSYAEACAYAVEMANQHRWGDYALFECIGRFMSDPNNLPGKPGLKRAKAAKPAKPGGT